MLRLSRKKTLNPQGEEIRNESIQRVTKAKFVSVIVEKHLNWKDHISIVSHISKSFEAISRIRKFLYIKSKKLIYHGLIHPNVNVCSSTYRTNLKTPCTDQKRSVRTLFATAQQPHSRDNFIDQKILSLEFRELISVPAIFC